jgi:hypothetical protein
MSDLGQAAFDHAAKLQQQMDRLELELGLLALTGMALGLAVMILGWRLWAQQ